MKVDWMLPHLAALLKNMEQAILATPTGDKRNLLTEANIHFLAGQQKLAEAARTIR